MFYCLILLASTMLNRSGKGACLLPNSKEKTSIFTSKYDKYFDLQFFLVNERFFPEWVFNVFLDNYFVCFFFTCTTLMDCFGFKTFAFLDQTHLVVVSFLYIVSVCKHFYYDNLIRFICLKCIISTAIQVFLRLQSSLCC